MLSIQDPAASGEQLAGGGEDLLAGLRRASAPQRFHFSAEVIGLTSGIWFPYGTAISGTEFKPDFKLDQRIPEHLLSDLASGPRAKEQGDGAALTQFIVVIDASITMSPCPSIGKALDIDERARPGGQQLHPRLRRFPAARRSPSPTSRAPADVRDRHDPVGAASLAGGFADRGLADHRRRSRVFGAAIASPAALSIVTTTFCRVGSERNRPWRSGARWRCRRRAAGFCSAACVEWAGWGGALRQRPDRGIRRRWTGPQRLVESGSEEGIGRTLDIPGAVTITAGPGLLVYGLVDAVNGAGDRAPQCSRIAGALVLIAALVVTVELRSRKPRCPPSRSSRNRTLRGANVVGTFDRHVALLDVLPDHAHPQLVLGPRRLTPYNLPAARRCRHHPRAACPWRVTRLGFAGRDHRHGHGGYRPRLVQPDQPDGTYLADVLVPRSWLASGWA